MVKIVNSLSPQPLSYSPSLPGGPIKTSPESCLTGLPGVDCTKIDRGVKEE